MKQILAIVKVAAFNKEGKSQDKNGKQNVILLPIAGKIPSKNVLAGTVAEGEGFEIGKTYLASVRELEPSAEFGRQFQWTKAGSFDSLLDLVKTSKEFGEGSTFDAGVAEVVPALEKEKA